MTMDKQQAIDLIRRSGLAKQADLLIDQLLPSVRLVVHDSGRSSAKDLVVSHFGGLPSLPPGMTWPVWAGWPGLANLQGFQPAGDQAPAALPLGRGLAPGMMLVP